MGCTSSKSSQCVHHGGVVIDDSIHAMIARERRHAKARGDQPLTYRPRAPHPLLQQGTAPVITAKEEDEEEEDAPTIAISDEHSDYSAPAAEAGHQWHNQQRRDSEDHIERLLRHSRYHCDTVDALDLPRESRRLIAGVVH